MNSTLDLYLRSPIWLQNVLVTAQGMRLRYLRYGRGQREWLSTLLKSQWLSADEHLCNTLRSLNSLVRHARSTVPLYRNLPAIEFQNLEQLRLLPILSKDELRAPKENLVSTEHSGARLQAVHTGGTTGKPLTIYCDRDVLQQNYAFFARLRLWAGIERGAKTATFAGRTIVPVSQNAPPFWRSNAAANTLLFSSYHISPATIPHYVSRLAQFHPDLIDSYPSSIEPIARYLRDHPETKISPRAIVTSSETLSPSVREVITDAFRCPVFDYYGGAEMAAFISQCEAGSYHVNPEFGIVEILRNGEPVAAGEPGEIVATGFINRVMPLIRYATGDIAAFRAGACSCGRAFPMIERLEGRKDDVVITPDGRRIGRLDPIFKAVSSIYESQIVQDETDHVQIQVVAPALPAREEEAILKELRNRLGPSMRIDLVRVPRIERTASGKLRTVVNKIANAENR